MQSNGNPQTNRKRSPRLLGFFESGRAAFYEGERHIIIIGGTGRGKTTHYWVPWICTDQNSIIAATDIAGELSMLCGDVRSKFGPVFIDNPHGILKQSIAHLPHGGCNPVSSLIDVDPKKFGIKAMKLAAGCVVKDLVETHKYWANTARTTLKAIIMAECIRGEEANLVRVAEIVQGDFVKYVQDVCAELSKLQQAGTEEGTPGAWEVVQTLRRYLTSRDDDVRSQREVIEQLRTDTSFLLDEGIAQSITRGDFRYADCRREVMSIFTVLGIDVIDVLDKYLRLQLANCLSDLINPDVKGDVPVTIYCDEYGVAARNGLDAMGVAFTAARKAQVTVCVSVTSLAELKAVHPQDWEALIASAGATIWMGPITDLTTGKYLSELCGQKEVFTGNLPGQISGRAGKKVITPAELAGLEEDSAIVFADFSRGCPMLLKHRSYRDMNELKDIVGKNRYYER